MKASTAKITRIALGVAVVAIGAQLAIPTIPAITLQTFAIFIMSTLLSPLESLIMGVVYILLGLVGVPVFSSFSSGLGTIMGLGGGFIISFPIIAALSSLLLKKLPKTLVTYSVSFTLATIISYVFGAIWIKAFALYEGTLFTMLSAVVLPFIPFDVAKIALSVICSKKIRSIFVNEKKNPNNKPKQD